MPKEGSDKNGQSRLFRLKQSQGCLPASVFAVVVTFLIFFKVEGHPFHWAVKVQEWTKQEWTGFGQSYDNAVSEVTEKGTETTGTITKTIDKTTTTTRRLQPAKTLWDWMALFLAPATLAVLGAGLGFLFQSSQEKAKREKEEADKARVADQQREQAIQIYFDQLSALLVDKQLKKLLVANQTTVPTKTPTERSADASVETEAVTAKPELTIDAEAALDVVKARTFSLLRMFDEDIPRKASVLSFLADADLLKQLDLDLSGIKLEGANLRKVSFSAFNLRGANLRGANLDGADLCFTDLSGGNLSGANLSGANLDGANLSDVNLFDATLTGASLVGATLTSAGLVGATLISTDFISADFSGADLSGADLSGSKLLNADLSSSKLLNADLSGANLQSAKFWDLKLTGTDLDRAKKDAVARIQSARNWQIASYDPKIRALLFLQKPSEMVVKD